jgi:hypothetical protein
MRVRVAVGIVRLICAKWVIVGLGGIARTSFEPYAGYEAVYSIAVCACLYVRGYRIKKMPMGALRLNFGGGRP